MHDTIVKIKDIVGEAVDREDARRMVDYLLACLVHVTNARPLFGVLNTHTEVLEWTAGGADFHDILSKPTSESAFAKGEGETSFSQLFNLFEISETDVADILEQMQYLAAGGALSMMNPMEGPPNRFFRLVLRRRREPNDAQVQFSLLDITPFQSAALRTKAMAASMVADLAQPLGDGENAGKGTGKGTGKGAGDALLAVVDGLEPLFALTSDDEIKARAQDLSAQITRVSERMVEMLLAFESRYDTSHWQPADLDPALRPIISVHNAPVNGWDELHEQSMIEVGGEPAIRGVDVQALKHAYDFVANAGSILVVSPVVGRIFVLNGALAGEEFTSVEDFVRGIGVEDNSVHTAVEYFSTLGEKPALGLFAMAGQNVEAWGRPGHYGGWQVMLATSQGQGVDVRGLFHGLKNLLLHLQVLYVVKTRADVEQVQEGLREVADKIRRRLAELETVARTGRRCQALVHERVKDWLAPLVRIGDEMGGRVDVVSDGIGELEFSAHPGEMEDTLEELVRNAFQHGAQHVRVGALSEGNYLCLLIQDDGRGMSDDKLAQLREVLETGTYDANLSTREDGTGNGLMAAANAVSRFVDGNMSVHHGPEGRGVEIAISMKLPG